MLFDPVSYMFWDGAKAVPVPPLKLEKENQSAARLLGFIPTDTPILKWRAQCAIAYHGLTGQTAGFMGVFHRDTDIARFIRTNTAPEMVAKLWADKA
jgi:hypothetical protein